MSTAAKDPKDPKDPKGPKATEVVDAPAEGADEPRRSGTRGRLGVVGPFAIAALLALAALVLVVLRPSTEGDADANLAVVDGRGTAQLVDAVTTGVEGAFAYDFRDPASSEAVAERFFTGAAVDDYDTLREAVSSLGEGQSLVYETDVTHVGVRTLEGDSAEVLVFVDQTSTRGTDGAVEEAPAQLVLDLERDADDTWQVSSIEQL